MPIKILIIEDEAIVRNIYSKLFDDKEFELHLVSTGYDGIEALNKNNDFQLILLDAGLPDMDGFAILEKIKGENPDLPVIMISGFDLAEQIFSLTKPEKVYFLRKPFTLEALYNLIHEALEN